MFLLCFTKYEKKVNKVSISYKNTAKLVSYELFLKKTKENTFLNKTLLVCSSEVTKLICCNNYKNEQK